MRAFGFRLSLDRLDKAPELPNDFGGDWSPEQVEQMRKNERAALVLNVIRPRKLSLEERFALREETAKPGKVKWVPDDVPHETNLSN